MTAAEPSPPPPSTVRTSPTQPQGRHPGNRTGTGSTSKFFPLEESFGMDANTVTAICATAIASASFVVSVQQGRANREHNRLSVLPALQIRINRHEASAMGVNLDNNGLGPAFITGSRVWLDGNYLGHWGRESVAAIRREIRVDLKAGEMNRQPQIVSAGGTRLLLGVNEYHDEQHADLWALIRNRLALEVTYQSLYGNKDFQVSYRLDSITSP